jgi:RNA polymerase sigma factor (sigma-70 family)
MDPRTAMLDASVVLPRLASDERLVQAVTAGSESAFEALFDRHHRDVRAFCRQMLGSPEEADDAAQLTFLAAYRELARSRLPFALRPWLFAIARNRCLAVLRARRERPVDALPEPASDHLGAEVARREELRRVLADLARLPDDQRAALVLSELGDASHQDIAEVLGCPRTKVKALVFQARESLAAAREARDTPCAEIREQLAALRGAALRRTALRRHVHDCAGCRAYREELRTRGRGFRAFSPVASIVALKRIVIEALVGSEGAAAAVGVGGVSLGGLAATALVTVAIPVAGVAAGLAALHDEPASGRADAHRAAALHAPAGARDSAPAFAMRRELHLRGGALRAATATPSWRRAGHGTAAAPAREPSDARPACGTGGCRAAVDRPQGADVAAGERPDDAVGVAVERPRDAGVAAAGRPHDAGRRSTRPPSSARGEGRPAGPPARREGRRPQPGSAAPAADGPRAPQAAPAATPNPARTPEPPAARSTGANPTSPSPSRAPSPGEGQTVPTQGDRQPVDRGSRS